MKMRTSFFKFKVKGFNPTVIIAIVLLLSRDPCMTYSIMSSSHENKVQCIQNQNYIENNTFYHKLVYRPLGKKATSNFLARYLFGNKANGISNFHLNIRSLKNKVNEVKHIINLYQPKIFGLSEVELKKTNVNESSLQIEGYTILFPKSWYIQGQARVVMYIKNYQNYVLVTDLEEESFQSIWIRIHQRRSKPIY